MSHPNTFQGSGNDYYQSTLQLTDTFGQEADMSANSLVTTKPTIIENETQQEVSVFFLPCRGSCSIIMALKGAKLSAGTSSRQPSAWIKFVVCQAFLRSGKWKELPVLQTSGLALARRQTFDAHMITRRTSHPTFFFWGGRFRSPRNPSTRPSERVSENDEGCVI